MAFDKEKYWKNRKAGRRGQASNLKDIANMLNHKKEDEKYHRLPHGQIITLETYKRGLWIDGEWVQK